MSRVKQLIQIINGCEKNEFDKIVKSYLKNIYGFDRIVVTDGKDDTGIDIKVFDYGGQEIQYQMTIQKSGTAQEKAQLKTKIFEDVKKAKTNTEYGYSNNLYFFYSYVLTNKTQREYERDALNNYNINLRIIDANQIAEESEEFIELQRVIYDQSGLAEFQLKKSLYEDENICLVYDLVSFGKSSDIKLEIVEAYIFQCLFEHVSLSQDQIAELCIKKFNSKENPTFYSKLINKLYSKEKKISYSKETKRYSLTPEECDVYRRRTEQMKLDEKSFINEIGTVLKAYDQENNIDDYINLLTELYANAFSKRIEIAQVLDSENKDLDKLLMYGKKQLGSREPEVKSLISQLIKVCDNNKYLQKSCASFIFSSKINIDNIEKYATERKQVYLDTTIALNILCLFYKKTNCNEYNYRLSRALSEYCRKNNIKLYITDRYLWEITGHLRESFSLIPFTKIPGFKSLGKSRNVFYNYYDYLIDEGILDCSFSEFLDDFGFRESDLTKTEKLNQTITKYLSEFGIEVIPIPCKYDIETTRKTLEIVLSEMERFKTSFAIENDCIMLKYLGDNDSDVHSIDPVFITWDKSLYKILKSFFDDNPNVKKWMQFTPSQFIDRHSLLSFSINSETISQEMLANLSGDIVQHTQSLLDSLSLILDPNTEIGLAYTKKFTEMKNSQIYTIGKVPKEGEDTSVQDPIDYVVNNITHLYKENHEDYLKFKELFSKKDYFDDIINLIDNSIKYYSKFKHFDKKIKSSFDELIENISVFPSTK